MSFAPRVLALLVSGAIAGTAAAAGPPSAISVDYPADGSIFPPEFPAPTFLWRDSAAPAASWAIDVSFADGSPARHIRTPGGRMQVGPIDPRCIGPTNRLPELTPEQAAAHTWTPDAATWAAIKQHSTAGPATVAIAGYSGRSGGPAISRGQIRIRTSRDPVGAPIFYRDVPLMPSESEKGVIKPLATAALPLIGWRLRNVGESSSHLLLEGLHNCANCHSFSRDGKTMGMDVDGPLNDKGLYAIVPVEPAMSIRNENVIAWSTFRGKLGGRLRVGFMSQVSPTGQYVVTTINDPGQGQSDYQRRRNPQDLILNYYVANFKDYRFLQVFYPTRGILAWYSRATGHLQPLPGADDPRYVHTNAVWSPDGKYLVFARAEAKDAYPADGKMAEASNDPKETQIQYDLYRIAFNDGAGGRPEPLAGASRNGMSNSFPKVSPDGRWVVFVKCRNGQLMRPDSRLYIVPSAGGPAREMRCNTPLMNSWHSFSPNGRWLVFSSKSRSPYTQMFLTHLDEDGNDSPAILIENSTAANRAVNIPEFVNVAPGGLVALDAPVMDYYRLADSASDLMQKNQYPEAVAEWKKALELAPNEAMAHNDLALSLVQTGKIPEAIPHYEKAIALSPGYAVAYNNLGLALVRAGRADEAIARYRKALELDPDFAGAHINLGAVLARTNNMDDAIRHFEKAIETKPDPAHMREAQVNLALALATEERWRDAIPHFEEADTVSGGRDPVVLDLLGMAYAQMGRVQDAIKSARKALAIAAERKDEKQIAALEARIALYESGAPLVFRPRWAGSKQP